MKPLKVFLLISLLALVSCSNNKKKESTAQTDNVILDMEDESDFIVDSDEEDLELSDSVEESVADVEAVEEMSDDTTEISMAENIGNIGNIGSYEVQKGDSLMLISFKIYGDYRKWRGLKEMNPGIKSGALLEGTTLSYNEPLEKFIWNPKGQPYLIKDGDSLGTISEDKYGTVNKWKSLWENNKPMIHDPNLIFAGFTLYYVADREIASE